MDKFYCNRSIVKRCQTGQLTQEEITQSMALRHSRIRQLYRQFQRHGESGLVVKRAPGAALKLTPEPHAQLPDLWSKGAEDEALTGR